MSKLRTCPETIVLEALADGRLQASERSEITAHLEGCPDCQRQLEEILQIKQDLKLAAHHQPKLFPGPDLEEKILAARRGERRRRYLAWVLAPATAAALLFLLTLALSKHPSTPVQKPAEAAKSALVVRVDGSTQGIEGGLVPAGKIISTGEDGRLLVQFGEGEYLFLGSLSRLLWREEQGRLTFDLQAGQALFRFEGPVHRNLLVSTPSAGVRTLGTVFSLELLPQQTLRLELYRGEVEVTTRRGAISRLQAHRCALATPDDVQWAECGRDLLLEMSNMFEEKPARQEPATAPSAEATAAAPLPLKKTTPPIHPQAVSEESLENRISAINSLLAKRQFDRAEPLIGELLRMHPEDFRPQLLACDSLRLQEKFEDALSACRRAEQLARQESQKEISRYQQGRLLLQLGRAAEAENVFSGLLAEFPQGLLSQESLFALLEAQLKQEKYSQARATALSYLEKYPRGAGAREVRELLERLPEEK